MVMLSGKNVDGMVTLRNVFSDGMADFVSGYEALATLLSLQ